MTRALFYVDTPHRLAGSQRSLLAALAGVHEHGVEPLVVVPAEGIFPDMARQIGVRVHVMDAPDAFRMFDRKLVKMGRAAQAGVAATQLLPFAASLARLVDRERVDVVHFNTQRGIVMAGAAATMSGRRAVMHVRGRPPPFWRTSQMMADRLILVARALLADLSPSVAARADVVHNGVVAPPPLPRAEARARLRARLGDVVPSEGKIVLSLSSFTPFKGLHHLVHAARLLKDRGVRATYLLAGGVVGDAYEAWLRALPSTLGVEDQVKIVGFLRETSELLSAADMLVLPSVEAETLTFDGRTVAVRGTEGLPRSILEAMIAGRPVVTTRVAGVEEQIDDGVTGMIVAPGDAASLADGLERLLEDDALCARSGDAARDVASERFSVSAASRGLARVLRREADAHPPAPLLRALDRGRSLLGIARDEVASRLQQSSRTTTNGSA